jgi:hypothetical protein
MWPIIIPDCPIMLLPIGVDADMPCGEDGCCMPIPDIDIDCGVIPICPDC